MLDLTRYPGQRIRIGEDVCIIVRNVDLTTGRVYLSIEAPREIAVHREEIYQRIRAERDGLPPSPGLTGQYQRWK